MYMKIFSFLNRQNHTDIDGSLDTLYQKYHNTEAFREILQRRVKENPNEVRDFINKNFVTMGSSTDTDLHQFIAFFSQYYPVSDILSWNYINHIDLQMCEMYLMQDFSWIYNDLIVSKIDKKDLYEFVKTNHLLQEKLYIRRVLALLDIDMIREILENNEENKKEIFMILENIEDVFLVWNASFITKFLTKKTVEKVSEMPNHLFERLIQLEIIQPILKSTPNSLYQLLSQNPHNMISSLEEDWLISYLQTLSDDRRVHLLIEQNLLYEKVKGKIPYIYIEEETEKLLPLIKTSSYVFDYFMYSPLIISSIKEQEKLCNYILQDFSLLQKVLEYPSARIVKILTNYDDYSETVRKSIMGNSQIILLLLSYISKPTFDRSSLHFLFVSGYIKGLSIPCPLVDMFLEEVPFNIWLEFYEATPLFSDYIEKNKQILIKKCKKAKDDILFIYKFFDKYPENYTLLEDTELLQNLFFNVSPTECMGCLDVCSNLEKKIIQNSLFIKHIVSSEENTFAYLYLLNKYNIKNDLIQKYNENFRRIQENRPELSLGNSSLKKEMLDSTFLDTIGDDYINTILQYNTEASTIVVNLYQKGELSHLRKCLDYLCENISDNRRMVHFYIMGYEKSKKLLHEILDHSISLTPYEKDILKEIILQDNRYSIQSVSDLKNYLLVKWNIIKKKKFLSVKDVEEIFFNTSALEKGVPWNLDFKYNKYCDEGRDYFQYKYIDTDLIKKDDFTYLQDIYHIIKGFDKTKPLDSMGLLEMQNLLIKYKDKEVPTARMFEEIIRRDKNKELNEHLIDLEEVRKCASMDPSAPVYIEKKDGVEIIYLNEYDYRSLVHAINDIELLGKKQSTFSEAMVGNFEQYIILGEKVSYKVERKNLSGVLLGETLRKKPESWNLIEGISTISTGVCSPRHPYYGLGFGKRSFLSICGESGNDANVSHTIRDVAPGTPSGSSDDISYAVKPLYGIDRGEYWFDRDIGYFNGHNQRVQPEFIMASFVNREAISQAKQYHVPIIIDQQKYTRIEYSNKVDLQDRHSFEKTLQKKYLYNIYLNPYNPYPAEKIDFIISCIQKKYEEGEITEEFYERKLTEVKWFFYEQRADTGMKKIDNILGKRQKENIIEEAKIHS